MAADGTPGVRLLVPGDSVYAFAPRVVAAWLVAGMGAEIDAVEDARLAVDELVGPFVAAGRDVEVSFAEGDQEVTVEVVAPGYDGDIQLTPLAQRILSVVAAGCIPLDGRPGYTVRLRASSRPS